MISRERIQQTENVIRPHIRRTPILEVDGAEFGLDSIRIVFKLELFQHQDRSKHAARSQTFSREKFLLRALSLPPVETTALQSRLQR